jgi:hypothetical protein
MALRSDLSQHERMILKRSLDRQRRELALVMAREALRTGQPGVRRRLARIAVSPGYGLRTRVKVAGSALLTARAATDLARRESTSFVGAAGVRVEEPQMGDTPS